MKAEEWGFLSGIAIMCILLSFSIGLPIGAAKERTRIYKEAEQHSVGAWVPNKETREFEWQWKGDPDDQD